MLGFCLLAWLADQGPYAGTRPPIRRAEAEAAEQQRAAAEEALRRRKSEKRAVLGEEPPAGTPETTLIRVRMPDGATHQRRFWMADSLQVTKGVGCMQGGCRCCIGCGCCIGWRCCFGCSTCSLSGFDSLTQTRLYGWCGGQRVQGAGGSLSPAQGGQEETRLCTLHRCRPS